MSREALLKISKELADYIINGKSTTLRKEHYFMLSISKFIITKERLIQTDSDGKILYFDDTDDNKRTINKFYKLIKDRFSLTMDNNDISSDTFNNVVLSIGKEDSELKRKVYIINKLRDSLAHGRYRFDTASDNIIVENDYEVNSHHYSFNCSVEPELLEVLALTPKEVDKALKQYERGNNSYNYFITLANSILNMKEKIDFESNTYTKDERKELESLFDWLNEGFTILGKRFHEGYNFDIPEEEFWDRFIGLSIERINNFLLEITKGGGVTHEFN